MAEENQAQPQNHNRTTTSYKRTTTSYISNERTTMSNYKEPKESRSW